MKITALRAREILDSRGIPTIETTLELDNRFKAKSSVPSGDSTGATEVLELRDDDPIRYFGNGVLKAVDNVNTTIAQQLLEKTFLEQRDLDNFLKDLDNTQYKSNLGGNTILSVSMAFARATAMLENLELYEYFGQLYWGHEYDKTMLQTPQPMILIMEGGKHGNWATDFQEYMIVPNKTHFYEFKESLRAGAEIFKAAHDILLAKGYSAMVGFEGAFAPTEITSNKEAFEIMIEAIEVAGYKPGTHITLSADVAASEFYDPTKKTYNLKREESVLTSDEWIDLQAQWIENYPISIMEDPFDQEDWASWTKYTERFGEDLMVVGDDLLTTNVERIQKAIDMKAVNGVIIKLNQIGTVTETLDVIRLSKEAGFETIVSHRGGETNDDMIADLVVGTASNICKFGGPDRGERIAKYNRLLEIEEDLAN